MKSQPAFLSVEQVRAIHRRMTDTFGGDPSLRDSGLLESAVHLPAAQFDGKFLHEDIPAMAAAYLFHLCRNHAFVDGNKRTALAAAEVFLLVNGYSLEADDEALEALTMGVAGGDIGKEAVTVFFKKHARPA